MPTTRRPKTQPSEDEVLRRMLNSPPKDRTEKAPVAPIKKSANTKRAAKKGGKDR